MGRHIPIQPHSSGALPYSVSSQSDSSEFVDHFENLRSLICVNRIILFNCATTFYNYPNFFC